MNPLIKYGAIAAVIGGIVIFNGESDGYSDQEIDLNAVLDVTVDTIYSYQDQIEASGTQEESDALLGFSSELQTNYNSKVPAIFEGNIGVEMRTDASFLAFDDKDSNGELSEGEDALFLIEIDGENSRVIASSRSGAVNDHHFSGTGLLAGFLLGSILNRQSKFGNPAGVANKQKITSSQANAKARAGSGSHSKGK
ncbi:hypothetical protein [Marinicellulosiphila megalodicopiae]|uniref:hypothetical protein n=1 Tax=Marinicellulosiphila megalodicopiae TaxID=2724896 RepID=UPI003BAF7920